MLHLFVKNDTPKPPTLNQVSRLETNAAIVLENNAPTLTHASRRETNVVLICKNDAHIKPD